jgi:hypothetical protein
MKVLFIAEPLAQFACRRAEPRIAGMSLMDLVTVDLKLRWGWWGARRQTHLGTLQRSGQE